MVVMNVLGVKLGFTFSAGLFDYLLSFNLGQNGLYLIPVGIVYALIYYVLFKWAIVKFDLQTPGRESVTAEEEPVPAAPTAEPAATAQTPAAEAPRGAKYLKELGGKENIKTIDACATRLRVEVVNADTINTPALKTLGARGVVKSGGGSVQVVIGPEADLIADEIKEFLK